MTDKSIEKTAETIEFSYKKAFSDFCLDLNTSVPLQGNTVIFGPPGSGKSTLLNLLSGIDKGEDSFLKVANKIYDSKKENIFLKPYERDIGYILQEPFLFNNMTARENIEFALKVCNKKNSFFNFQGLVSMLGIQELLDKYPDHLSGGQKQQISIARTLITEPAVLLADEPFNSQDEKSRSFYISLFKNLKNTLKIKLVMVTHSLKEIIDIADHVILLDKGKILSAGITYDVLFKDHFLMPVFSKKLDNIFQFTLDPDQSGVPADHVRALNNKAVLLVYNKGLLTKKSDSAVPSFSDSFSAAFSSDSLEIYPGDHAFENADSRACLNYQFNFFKGRIIKISNFSSGPDTGLKLFIDCGFDKPLRADIIMNSPDADLPGSVNTGRAWLAHGAPVALRIRSRDIISLSQADDALIRPADQEDQ
jgi:ABC-type molybdate transport system ATPase subunit